MRGSNKAVNTITASYSYAAEIRVGGSFPFHQGIEDTGKVLCMVMKARIAKPILLKQVLLEVVTRAFSAFVREREF
jgi:hypothetical protein